MSGGTGGRGPGAQEGLWKDCSERFPGRGGPWGALLSVSRVGNLSLSPASGWPSGSGQLHRPWGRCCCLRCLGTGPTPDAPPTPLKALAHALGRGSPTETLSDLCTSLRQGSRAGGAAGGGHLLCPHSGAGLGGHRIVTAQKKLALVSSSQPRLCACQQPGT